MDSYIYHHGIKGMKWGVRRYQNEDGSLTPAGKKRISKKYKNLVKKTARDQNRQAGRMYIETNNKTADYMNRVGIDMFNERQRKRYGDNYADRSSYYDDYQKEVDRVFQKIASKTLSDFYESNKYYQRAKELVDKYDMTKWDDLARGNEENISNLRRNANKNR